MVECSRWELDRQRNSLNLAWKPALEMVQDKEEMVGNHPIHLPQHLFVQMPVGEFDLEDLDLRDRRAFREALVNALVVPLTQAAAGDPMGAALRSFGPNVASEDARQYAAFMTAHALHMRALIGRAHPALAPKFAMEMDRAINAVVWREQGRPGTVTGKPLPIASGVDPIIDPAQAKDAVDAALMASPYTRTQRYKVVSFMLARILLSDELPVHTFTLLNGVTGYLNTLWPAMFGLSSSGQAISRVVDAAAHTGAGFFAMYFMFLLQDLLRPMVQGVGPIDPTDEAYRDDQLEPLDVAEVGITAAPLQFTRLGQGDGLQDHGVGGPGRAGLCGPAGGVDYWQASQSGLSMLQNLASVAGRASSCGAAAWAGAATPPATGTAFSSPPRPVDFSALEADRVRR